MLASDTAVASYIVPWVRNRRRSKGWTLRALAERLGVTAATLSNIETGQHVPRVGLAEALGRELGGSGLGGERAAQALSAWASLNRMPSGAGTQQDRTDLIEKVDRFIEGERSLDAHVFVPTIAAGRSRRGRPLKPAVLPMRSPSAVSEGFRSGRERNLLHLPVFREEDDPGDPRIREPEPIAHRYVDRRTLGDPIGIRWAYMIKISRSTAERLGAPFAVGDIAILSREGMPGASEEVFHMPHPVSGYRLEKVVRKEGNLIVFDRDEEGGVRLIEWPNDLSAAARLVPGRLVGVLHRGGW